VFKNLRKQTPHSPYIADPTQCTTKKKKEKKEKTRKLTVRVPITPDHQTAHKNTEMFKEKKNLHIPLGTKKTQGRFRGQSQYH
jgi:hypothetical protein